MAFCLIPAMVAFAGPGGSLVDVKQVDVTGIDEVSADTAIDGSFLREIGWRDEGGGVLSHPDWYPSITWSRVNGVSVSGKSLPDISPQDELMRFLQKLGKTVTVRLEELPGPSSDAIVVSDSRLATVDGTAVHAESWRTRYAPTSQVAGFISLRYTPRS